MELVWTSHSVSVHVYVMTLYHIVTCVLHVHMRLFTISFNCNELLNGCVSELTLLMCRCWFWSTGASCWWKPTCVLRYFEQCFYRWQGNLVIHSTQQWCINTCHHIPWCESRPHTQSTTYTLSSSHTHTHPLMLTHTTTHTLSSPHTHTPTPSHAHTHKALLTPSPLPTRPHPLTLTHTKHYSHPLLSPHTHTQDTSDFRMLRFDISLVAIERIVSSPVSGNQAVTSLSPYPSLRHNGDTMAEARL